MYTSHSDKRSVNVLYARPQDAFETSAADNVGHDNVIFISGWYGNFQNLLSKFSAKIPARLVLYFLSWSGFMVSFMMRNDINFALVAMTRSVDEQSTVITRADIGNETITNATITNFSINQIESIHNEGLYPWSPTVKSVIVSSFYWCYVLSQVVGGIATQYFGTKHVFGWSQFATAICSLCIPTSADLHYIAVIVLRSIQGFASGLTWPAMYAIVSYWIPLSERSRFMSSFQGFSIGIGLTYPLCGFLIETLGWRSIFYCTGSLGILWCLLWYLFAFNTPQQHPRITADELNYIEMHISEKTDTAIGMKVPWCSIFTSLPALAIGITTFGRIWIHYVFIVSGPSFMKNILKFEYQANGFLSGMPFICSYLSSVVFCYAADKIVLHKLMNLTNVRKLFTALSQVVPGLLIYWIGYINDILLLLIIWFIAVSFITASYAGAMANIVDIAPNLAGPVLAFCQTIHMSASFLSPLVSGIIVTNENSIEEWRTNFGISSAVTILTYIFYQLYGTADVQDWNNNEQPSDGYNSSEESQILKRKTEEIVPRNN